MKKIACSSYLLTVLLLLSTRFQTRIQQKLHLCTFLFALFLLPFGSVALGQDLVISSIDASATSTNSQNLAISGNLQVGIANNGVASVETDFEVTVFEDRDGNGEFGALDAVLGTEVITTALAVGENANIFVPLNGAVTFAGNLVYVFVDSLDSVVETNETNNVGNTGELSQFQPVPGPFSPNLEWSWTSSTIEPNALNIMMTPAVIDLNGDDVPDVIFGSTANTGGSTVVSGFLRALDGRTGSELFTITDPDLRINTATSIAVGDIDLDGLPEIIASDDSCRSLIAFQNDGSFLWRSEVTDCTSWGAIAIADLNQDGAPEVLHGRNVFDNNGTRVWSGLGGVGTQGLGGMSLVADVDLDGQNEVVAGQSIYSATGAIENTLAGASDGYNAIGNFDTDDFAEIVHVGAGRVRLYNHDGSLVWGPVVIPGGGTGGPPTVADYDNDGEPEIGVAGATRYAVFETDGTLLWQSVTQDRSSNRTGSSVFDFEGDGSAEVVYRDELRLRVYRGTDGEVLFETDMSSCTWHEYVLVADVDADGNAEIVAVANNNCGFGPQRGVFVFGAANDNWVATRQLWNQHTYHITNINSDGSIPTVEQNNWQVQGLNNYRLNEFLPEEGQSTDAPDLTSSFIRFDQSNCPASVGITARLGNGGSLFVPAGVNVSFYRGDPQSGGELIGTAVSSLPLLPGQFEDISISWDNPVVGDATIYVVADDNGTGAGFVSEGNEVNNSTEAEDTFCAPTCIEDLSARAKRGKIQLTWTDVPGSEYVVLRSDALSGVYTEIARTTSGYSTYLDAAITLDQTNYYQIRREPGVLGEAFCTSDIIAAQAPSGRVRMSSVPNVVGLADTEAAAAIIGVNLTVGGVSTVPSDTVPNGSVVAQDPPQNSTLPRGATVDYVLSSGSTAQPNTPPAVDIGSDLSIDEGGSILVSGNFVDTDTDTWAGTVDYGDGAGARPLFLSPANTFELSNSYVDNGVFTVTVVISDGSDIGSDELVVTVNNVAPIVVAGPDRTIDLGEEVSTDIATFTDVGMVDTHTATIDWGDGNAVESGTVNEINGSGSIAASRTYTDPGMFTVTVIVTDDDGGVASDSFDVEAVAPNAAPIVNSSPITSATESLLYVYDVEANDPDGDTLSYSLLVGPLGMSINGTSGIVQWTPSVIQLGDNAVQVQVDDGRGGTATQSFVVTVDVFVPPNQQPTIISTPVLAADEGQPYSYDADASDSDGDPLTYSLLVAPAGMTINAGTGLIGWTPATAQVGDNNVQIQVDDGNGGVATQNFTIVVTAAPLNQSPSINSTPSTNATEDQLYSYDVDATDADGDTLTYGLLTSPAGMTINASTGLVNWTPASGQVGDNAVQVQVTDGNGGTATQSFTIAVAAVPNQSPVISSSPSGAAIESQLYSYDVDATDVDGDTLTYSLDIAPVGMTINAGTGLIAWTPGATQVGANNVTVRVEDGNGGLATQSYSITVTAVVTNQPPSITSAPVTTGQEDNAYSYDVNATDPNGDVLTYSLDTAPAGMDIDAASGLINWTPVTAQIGDNAVTVRADDGNGGAATQSFTIAVTAAPLPNQAPVIISMPPVNATADASYQYDVAASDADGDVLTYSLIVSPAGMGIDASSGLVSWVPNVGQVGSQNVTVRVSDAQAFAEQSFNVLVTAVSLPLDVEVTASPSIIDLGETTTVTVAPLGGVAGTIDLSLTVNGVPVALDAGGQAVITGDVLGGFDLLATATDSQESVSNPGFFSVRDPSDNVAPVVAITSPVVDAIVTEPVDIVGTASDANLVNYRLLLSPAGQSNFVEFARSTTAVNNGVLGLFDPSLLAGGIYDVLLVAVDANGLQSTTSTTYQVEGELKVGNFSFTVEDLNVPLAGLPIRITRTYDSRRRNEDLDFGFGWTVGYQDLKIDESRVPGRFWELTETPTGPFGIIIDYCVEPQGEPTVTVTLPNGDIERFEAAASPRCNQVIPILDVNLVFNPVGDTQSTLQALNDTNARLLGGDLVETGTFSAPVNPSRYLLTTRAGFQFTLDQNFGIVQVVDPNGNTLTYSDTGITHSSGASVDFVRDSDGRITQVVDPAGNAIVYDYSSLGDLTRVTERDGAETQYTYNRGHGLLDIIDPLGRNVIRNIYDDDGRLIAQEDQLGVRTSFDHDLTGRQSIVTDKNGNTTVLFYDERGNITSQVDALGNTTTFSFDANDNELTRTDALGNTTTATYNSDNDQLTQTDALGNSMSFLYNSRGDETRIEDARGNATVTTYDSVGNLLTVTDPDGNVAGNNINARGLVTRETDLLGNSTDFTYDGNGNILTETDAEGAVKTFTYDANNNVLSESLTRTVSGGTTTDTTTFVYDVRDRIVSTTDALGNTVQSEYDLLGRETAQIDELGRRTEMDYDAYGRLIETRYPDGSSETISYDSEGNLLTETDRLGRTTAYVYDALNRHIQTFYPDSTNTQTEYDAAGRVTAEIDALGNRTEHEYDAVNRRTLTRDALGNEMTFTYDAEGNLTAQTDANGNTTLFAYNALDQRTLTTYPDGSTQQQTYDALGRVTAKTDQAGFVTTYAYDGLGQLVSVTDALGGVTSYTYDEAGNKLTQTDANGNTTTWTYDALGRAISRTLPGGQVETIAYDAVGNLSSHTDFNGVTHNYTYDVNDRLVQVDYADGSQESFTYDAMGNRLTATNGDGTISYNFDDRDRLLSETKPDGNSIAYAYDAAGNRTQVVRSVNTNTGTLITTDVHSFDPINRLATTTDSNGNTTSYSYDAVGNRQTLTYPNGNLTTFTYDILNRLTNLETVDSSAAVVQSYAYSLNATGRRTQVIEAGGRIIDYTYDDLYRLSQETVTDALNGNYSANYQYDATGNRIESVIDGVTTVFTYDTNDRLTGQGSTTYTYDDNGNTLTQSDSGVTNTYGYNSQNELISFNNGSTATTYTYNPDGVRTGQSDGLTDVVYLNDNNRDYSQVLTEVANGDINVDYVYGDDLISQNRAGDYRYYQYDGLGATRRLTDDSGAQTDEYNYDAFGIELNSSGATDNTYRFNGEQYDVNLDQYYLRARYYSQNIGRFTQADTWMGINSDPITLHKYLYANVDPANVIDPSGNFGLASFSVSFNIRSTLARTSVPSFAGFISRAVGATIKIAGRVTSNLARNVLRKCIKKKDKCKLRFNMLIVGFNHPDMLDHIRDAQISRPRTIALTYAPNKKRKSGWYNNKGGCALPRPSASYDCDEYPMQRTREGGPENWPIRVSLRWVPAGQNRSVGGYFGVLAKGMKKSKRYRFFVITTRSFVTVALPLAKKRR